MAVNQMAGRCVLVSGRRRVKKPSLRRDLARTLAWTAAAAVLLGSLAGAGIYRKELRACYYAVRLVSSGHGKWAERLADAGPHAAPARRLAYRLSSEETTKWAEAEALGECAGAEVLLALVEAEGCDTPAEDALINRLFVCAESPPPGAEVILYEETPPSEDLEIAAMGLPFPRIEYALGPYTVQVDDLWSRGFWGSYNSETGESKSGWHPWRLSGRSVTVARDGSGVDGPPSKPVRWVQAYTH